MNKFYKVVSNGVARFIEVDNIKALKRMKKDFDGKLVVDSSGEPTVFSNEDLVAIQRGASGVGNTVDSVSVNSIFKDDDTIKD